MTTLSTQATQTASLDTLINEAIQPITDAVSSFVFYAVSINGTQIPLIVMWLIAGGVFFTFLLALHQHTRLSARVSRCLRPLRKSRRSG